MSDLTWTRKDLLGIAELEPAAVLVSQRAHLDIIVKHDSFEKLPGVTIDIRPK